MKKTNKLLLSIILCFLCVQVGIIGVFADATYVNTPARQITPILSPKSLNRLFEKNKSKIGRTINVLAEDQIAKDMFVGRSEGDSPDVDGSVIFKSKNTKIGEFALVKINKAREYDLEGMAE